MNINIFGSTGIIGNTTLKIIKDKFPFIKINLLCANRNYKLLINQSKLYKPKYLYLHDKSKFKLLKSEISNSSIILDYNELCDYLKKSTSSYTILAVSGYKSLNYLEQILSNTDNLGLVSKEAIVSAGHLFKKKNFFKKTNIFPLDSEHFSIYNYFNRSVNIKKSLKNIIITASGGPFHKKKFSELKNISFNEAIKHPKWKMGYKNSIDSATLVNKCLEIIEAHYLFDIPYERIKILIHPEAIVHSIIETDDYVSTMNLFKNDMSIPIINFLMNYSKKKINKSNDDYSIQSYNNLSFFDVKNNTFPIYKYFYNLDKSSPANIIKFNIGNEYAVNLFKKGYINYTDIYKIIKKVGSLNLYSHLITIKDIINYHEEVEKKIINIFKN